MSVAVNGNYYGAGAGVDGYTGKFIPEVWSGKLAVKFYIATCLTEITNNDWEGEISDVGDKVKIRSVPTVTISNYTKGQSLTKQVPGTTVIELNIDQGKYFAVVVDDVDAVQSDIKLMDSFSQDAAEQMKIAVEASVFSTVYTQAHAKNKGATAGQISGNLNLGATGAPFAVDKTNVLDFIVDVGLALDEQNVPETGRWMVLPAWMCAMIKKSDLKDASISGDGTSILRNGRIGNVDRFTIYSSNNLTYGADGADTAFEAMAGTKDAISFASQITKVETLRSTDVFGDIMRGLNVYGFKVTKPEALVHMHIKKG
jgi:hypothetical protein